MRSSGCCCCCLQYGQHSLGLSRCRQACLINCCTHCTCAAAGSAFASAASLSSCLLYFSLLHSLHQQQAPLGAHSLLEQVMALLQPSHPDTKGPTGQLARSADGTKQEPTSYTRFVGLVTRDGPLATGWTLQCAYSGHRQRSEEQQITDRRYTRLYRKQQELTTCGFTDLHSVTGSPEATHCHPSQPIGVDCQIA